MAEFSNPRHQAQRREVLERRKRLRGLDYMVFIGAFLLVRLLLFIQYFE